MNLIMRTLKIFLILVIQFGLYIQAWSDDSGKDYLITIKTKFGEMRAILYDETPKHKENFLKLAKEGYFDSLIFHRVINHFMIQTGDPDSKGAAPGIPLGKGGPKYTIPAEFNPLLIHEKGSIAAARESDNVNPNKESSGSQFYIVQGRVFTKNELLANRVNFNLLIQYFNKFLQKPENKSTYDQVIQLQQEKNSQAVQRLILSKKDEIEKQFSVDFDLPVSDLQIQKYTTVGGTPHLDGEYTVFGKVIQGLDIIDKIAEVQTDSTNRPLVDILISIKVEEMPRKKITQLYGYQYPQKKP
jgi:cyclophilin family peptidyl-prolyl cis-trans isomerase